MTLESLSYLSQTVAALAVVVSLVFLALQVRHATWESRHQHTEEAFEKLRAVLLEVAADPDRAQLWLSGLHDFAKLDSVGKVRFLLTAHIVLKTNESFFLAYRNGRLAHGVWEPEERHMTDFFAYAGMQTAWDIRKHYFHADFRTWVDGKITALRQNESPPDLYREGSAQAS